MLLNFLTKIIIAWKKPKIIIVAGGESKKAAETIFSVLNQHFSVVKVSTPNNICPKCLFYSNILIIEAGTEQIIDYVFLVKNSRLPILTVAESAGRPTGISNRLTEMAALAQHLPDFGYLIFNFDNEDLRELRKKTRAKVLCFGFHQKSKFRATDIVASQPSEEGVAFSGTNFKINYEKNIVPVWLKETFGEENIYAALAAAAVGTVFDLNLVEISQMLKNLR